MILEKKKMRAAVRFVLIMFIFCTLVSYTGSITVNAGISPQKHDLIAALYPALNDDVQREAVFNAIVKPGTYEMKDVSTNIAAYNMADAINALLDPAARISRDTLKTLLQDFYQYQLTSLSITKFALRQFRDGLDIDDDLYGTYGGFNSIKSRIESYTVNYLLFVNFVKEVKDIYDAIKSQEINPLYLDDNNKIVVYDDLLALGNIASLFTDDARAEDYKDRLLDLLDALNATASSAERESFAKNLNAHNLLDLKQRGTSDGGGNHGSSGGQSSSVAAPNSYSFDIPGNSISKPTASEYITKNSPIANITIPSNIFANDASVKNKNVKLTITKVDKSTLPVDLQQKVGNKPIISLSFYVDGAVKEYNNPNAPVTISFKYTPTAEEALNPEFLNVWYMDNAGNLVKVPTGRYDAATGTFSFTTTHFSKYMLVFDHVTFTDVENTHWAKKEIEVLASKGIASGTSDKTFAPSESITRGDYMAMLVRALGVNTVVSENFSDIKVTDANFKEIAIAKKLGITNGVGNNKFMPDEYITRQDLMVLTDRAMTVAKKVKEKGTAADLEKFSDKSKVADYAIDSVANMVKEGICIGFDNMIGPVEKTTRAQAATIVYRIYNK